MYQPIYLDQNPSNLVGFVMGVLDWKSIVQGSFVNMYDFDCVISSEDFVFTYSVQGDSTKLQGEGDLHDQRFSAYAQSAILRASLRTPASAPVYTLTLYPTSAFFRRYRTYTGTYVGIAVGVVLGLLTVMFMLYDYMLRCEKQRKVEILEAKRRFVRFISHEIRTPLNSVHLGLELILEELKNMFSAKGVIKDLHTYFRSLSELAVDLISNSESAIEVLNDLLNYDKIEMGTLRLDLAAVSVWPLVEKCAYAFSTQMLQKNIALQLRGEYWDVVGGGTFATGGAPVECFCTLVVIGDANRIEQILRNLLSNSLKFTPYNGNITVQGK